MTTKIRTSPRPAPKGAGPGGSFLPVVTVCVDAARAKPGAVGEQWCADIVEEFFAECKIFLAGPPLNMV